MTNADADVIVDHRANLITGCPNTGQMPGHVQVGLNCQSLNCSLSAVSSRPTGAIGNAYEGGVQGSKLGYARRKVCLAYPGRWGKELERDFDAGPKRRDWPRASCEAIGGFLFEFARAERGAHEATSMR